MSEIEKHVIADREIMGGAPIFKGSRVAVETLFNHLIESSLEEFLDGYPSVTREQAIAVISSSGAMFIKNVAETVYGC
jgi:uncharacterized protein (DUF433 family)